MTSEQAETICTGSIVEHYGVRCMVNSTQRDGVAGPYFRLTPLDDCSSAKKEAISGLTSYKLCGFIEKEANA